MNDAGRCYEYQYRKNVAEDKEWDCNALWELFYNAFAFKGPCDVTSKDYENFLDALDEPVEKDKVRRLFYHPHPSLR